MGMSAFYAIAAIIVILFVASWLFSRWLSYREAGLGSVKPVSVRINVVRGSFEGASALIVGLSFLNSARNPVRLSGQAQVIVNGHRRAHRGGHQITRFSEAIPAGKIGTVEIECDRMEGLIPGLKIDGRILCEYDYEITKRAFTGQQSAREIAFEGKIDDGNMSNLVTCTMEVGLDRFDQYR